MLGPKRCDCVYCLRAALDGMPTFSITKRAITKRSDSGACCTESHRQTKNGFCFTQPQPEVEGKSFNFIRSARKYGMELESDTGIIDPNMTAFVGVHDGSINGIEYQSPIMQGDQGMMEVMILCSYGLKAAPSCGFHLHVDGRDLSFEQIARIGRTYKMLEDFFYHTVTPNRRTGSFAQCIHPDFTVTDRKAFTTQNYRNEDYRPLGKNGSYRTDWFNVHSWFFRGSVEIRLHHGTFDPGEIGPWVKLHTTFFDIIAARQVDFTTSQEALSALFAVEPDLKEDLLHRVLKHSPRTNGLNAAAQLLMQTETDKGIVTKQTETTEEQPCAEYLEPSEITLPSSFAV